jgi:[NiFe] hydrogenase small subunit
MGLSAGGVLAVKLGTDDAVVGMGVIRKGSQVVTFSEQGYAKRTGITSFSAQKRYGGGVQAAKPNPGGYVGVGDALGVKTLNIPGCPPNPINFVGTVVNYLLLGKLPALDNLGRPVFAYGNTIHDKCPRRSHFENDEFVEEFGSEEAAMGYCLYQLGCRGPETFNNCPIVKFNDGTSWPVEAGHPCIGCSEPNFWDSMSPFYEEM